MDKKYRLYFEFRKNEQRAGIQNEVFRVAVLLRVTAKKIYILTYSSFQRKRNFCFPDNVNLLKYFPPKKLQTCIDSVNCANQTGMHISKFSFALDK